MSASTQNTEDFKFIINEAIRLIQLRNQSYKLYKNDFDSDFHLMTAALDPPRDIGEINPQQRQFLLSSKAQKKLRNIATRQIKSNGLLNAITVNEFTLDIRDSIYIHIKNSGKLDSSGFSSLLSKAHKRANNKMQEVTYFFPFNAPSLSPEKEIQIGSVKIIHKDSIYAKVSDNSNYDLFVNNNNRNSFNCLLSITIPKCSNKISKNRAQNTAEFIFGVIKVFTTSYKLKANQINLISHPTKSNINHYIANKNDDYWIGGSYSFGEDLQDFWKFFEEDLEKDLGLVIKKLTLQAVSPSNKECLADRLIDAFYWFGNASRDTNSSAQVVKLVTAMERLVTVKDKEKNEGITENFCRRVSCLIAIYHNEINEWYNKARKVYNLRSNFVHGSKSIYKTYETDLGFDPFQLACPTILSACILFYKIGLELSPYEEKLKNIYFELSEICENEKYKMKKNINL
ncbi:HEPN domain-containing protein [Psychrobacter frigidicola]|uniref:HEPN domain-containing protein n=1 Tax=Psychrobacter frigidicola TaxID=45611 RepID=UPI001917D6DF|nr:HEPN domain-containing protein [Psychrobacter frigidicola]